MSDKGLYDNFIEENMEESDESIETIFINVDSFEDCDSLLYRNYDNTGKSNFQHNLPRYTLLNKSPIVIEDDDDDSLSDINNSRFIDVRNKLNKPTSTKNTNLLTRQASTSTVNGPKTTTTHLQPESSGYSEIDLNKSFLKPKQQLTTTSSKKSTSKLYLVFPNGEKYIINEIKNHTINPSLKFNASLSRTLKGHNGLIQPKPVKKYKMVSRNATMETIHLNEVDTSNQFIPCKYEHCGILVEEPELLIDNAYCSLECKNVDKKLTVTEEEQFINVTSKPFKKTTVHRNKRKQLFKTSCSKDMVKENNNLNEQFKRVSNEPSKGQLPLKSFEPISSLEAIDDDDDNINNNSIDLKHLIEDKNILKYMSRLQLKSAPKKLFNRPFPTEKNLFVVGQRLEGIDPKYEALFCVMTVSEVCGYRIKLHFDGYEHIHDFWVNADCPDLFYPGWCEMNSRILQPPYNYGKVFDWTCYLRECQSLPAPKRNFVSSKNLNSYRNPHKFHIGGKLEAVDKLTRTQPTQLIYVATVADIYNNRIRINFDGWSDDFDYWADMTSTYIHPVGWCNKNGQTLNPPGKSTVKKVKKDFDWTEYLAKTSSEPVPEDAFVQIPSRDFSINMRIEVVDLVVPRLLRIAKIVDVRDDELKIVYDGFDNDYAYWVENDSPDIHPVGWSSKTNHPIELPPASNTLWSCNIRGCKGYGNSSNVLKMNHVEIEDCPYNKVTWKIYVNRSTTIPDRLEPHDVSTITTLTRLNFPSNEPECDTIPRNEKIIFLEALGLIFVGHNLGSISMEPQSSLVIDGDTFLILTQDEIMEELKTLLCPAKKITNAILLLRQ